MIWKQDQPLDGVSFRLWKPYTKQGCRGDDSCVQDCKDKLGVIDETGTCYAYKILKKLCVKVGDFETESEIHMAYDEGCYTDDNGEPSLGFYDWGMHGRYHEFTYVPVFLRHMDDPQLAYTEHNYVNGTNTEMFFWISIILTIIGTIILMWLVMQYFKFSNMDPQEAAKLIS